VPYLTGRVVDNANILSASAKQKIAQLAEARETAAGDQVVVLTMPFARGREHRGLRDARLRCVEARPEGQGQRRARDRRAVGPQDAHRGRLRLEAR
jgi:hypothetical protein